MSDLITFHHSDLIDALYYFEYHGPMYKHIKWLERDKNVRTLFKLIRTIKFSMFKFFLPWARNLAVSTGIESPTKLAKYIIDNPPKGKFGEKWVEESEKTRDILKEIYNLYINKVLTKEKKKYLEELRERIITKYSSLWEKLSEQTEKLPGISWKRKEPKVCLIFPLDGRLSHKLKFSDTAYIETSEKMLEDETYFLHEVVKLLNYSKPIGAWVRQDRRGIRAIAYELFTELQTIKLASALFGRRPNFNSIVTNKLYGFWIPFIRAGTSFDEDELERILSNGYKIITKDEFDAQYQMGEIYTELNIILLT